MDIWKLLTEFQETNKMVIKAHTPWELDKPMLIRPRNQVKAISHSVENARVRKLSRIGWYTVHVVCACQRKGLLASGLTDVHPLIFNIFKY